MRIEADFDGGNIDVLGAGDGADFDLAIRADTEAPEFRQWFSFDLVGAKAGTTARLRIVNAGDTTYPDAWDGYRACASRDAITWFRVPTTYDGQTLLLEPPLTSSGLHIAYFAPYPWARHERLLGRARRSSHMRVETVGRSVEGRPMDVVVVGNPGEGKRNIWIIGRQHPGETQAEWFLEGALERLLDDHHDVTKTLLDRAAVFLVPNMNPDGGVRGNLRTNAAGTNLNRAWLEPGEATSPEVLAVRNAMHERGVDLFLDVHADERNPYCFLAGCEGNPSYSERLRDLENAFEQSLLGFDEDFQDAYGYDRDEPGGGDLRTAGNYVGERFDCLSYTVEMPFKDAANHPDPVRGWTPERAKRLGRAALESAVSCLGNLR